MIVQIPFRWESVEGAVGESVELPISAPNVTVLPASEDTDRIVVSSLVGEQETDLETEERPIQKVTVRRYDLYCLRVQVSPLIYGKAFTTRI